MCHNFWERQIDLIINQQILDFHEKAVTCSEKGEPIRALDVILMLSAAVIIRHNFRYQTRGY